MNIYFRFSAFGRYLLIICLFPGVALATLTAESLLQRLHSDYVAMKSAEQDYHQRRDQGTLSGIEATDYAAYVASLHRRVAEDCVALSEQAIPVPADLTCPDKAVATVAPAAIDQSNEQTGAEATAALEAELFSGLGEFDEMLLREQQRIRAATPRTDSGSDGSGGMGSASAASSGAEGEDGSTSDSSEYAAVGAGSGAPLPPGESSAPPGTPDGSDDDVVARQLREAAEKEADTELKKKLWEEYRKYKQGIE